jgi:hypothetical protein
MPNQGPKQSGLESRDMNEVGHWHLMHQQAGTIVYASGINGARNHPLNPREI